MGDLDLPPLEETGASAPASVEEPKKEKDYFEIIGSTDRRFVVPDGSIVDLRLGVPKNALDFYKKGKSWLGLKPGAEVLFSDLSKSEIQKLIDQASRKKDVTILKKALK